MFFPKKHLSQLLRCNLIWTQWQISIKMIQDSCPVSHENITDNSQKYKSNYQKYLSLISKGTGHCPVTKKMYQTFSRSTCLSVKCLVSGMDISPCLVHRMYQGVGHQNMVISLGSQGLTEHMLLSVLQLIQTCNCHKLHFGYAKFY